MKPAISFRDVSFSYSDHLVLDRVSFEINEGEAVSIVGPNGGGKTTILKLILGLIRPKTGYLEVLQARPSVVSIASAICPNTTDSTHFSLLPLWRWY